MIKALTGEGTVEFRIHFPTVNRTRVLTWLTIVASIVQYAKRNAHHIFISSFKKRKITLEDVVSPKSLGATGRGKFSDMFLLLSQYLIAYIAKEKRSREYEILQAIENAASSGLRGKYRNYVKQASQLFAEDSEFSFEINNFTLWANMVTFQ